MNHQYEQHYRVPEAYVSGLLHQCSALAHWRRGSVRWFAKVGGTW